MPIKIQLGKIPEIVKRERVLISPQEKFNRLSRRIKNKSKENQLRKFHFNVIEAGKTIVVFDGEGIEVLQAENSRNGYALARIHCRQLFLSALLEDRNGGFIFNQPDITNREDIPVSISLKAPKEPIMKICNCCNFYFPIEEITLHICSRNWLMIS